MDPEQEHASFAAYSPTSGVLFGYRWRFEDFPWCGIWEENHSRRQLPWDGKTMTRGMEFGVSPIPETEERDDQSRVIVRRACICVDSGENTVSVTYEARITKSESGDLNTLFTDR